MNIDKQSTFREAWLPSSVLVLFCVAVGTYIALSSSNKAEH